MKYDKKLTLPIVYGNNEKRERIPLFKGLLEFHESHFMYLVNSLGHGVVLNNEEDALVPNIESNGKNIKITLNSGIFLDKEGNMILIPKETSFSSFNIEGYRKIFFYIKAKKIEDDNLFWEDKRTLIKHEVFDYEIIISPTPDDKYVEICRVELDGYEILYPENPFQPKENEMDLRFVPRIISNNYLSKDIKYEMAEHLYLYGAFFIKLASKLSSFSASVISSEAYSSASKIKFDNLSTFEIYDILSRIIELTTLFYYEVEDRVEDIKESYSGQRIKRLESIFNGKNSISNDKVSFYKIYLHEGGNKENFWENIFSEIQGIYESKDSWSLIKGSLSSNSNVKNYLLVGRKGESGLDIEIDDEWVSANHLRITKNDLDPTLLDIEDLDSTNGTYLRGVRYEKHQKVSVCHGDKITLYTYEFDIYDHPIVRDFLEDNI